MIFKIQLSNFIQRLYGLFFVLMTFTGLSVIPGGMVKYYHLVGGILFILIIYLSHFKISLFKLSDSIILFCSIILFYSFWGYLIFVPNTLIINYCFAFLSMILGAKLFDFFKKNEVEDLLQKSAQFILLAIFVKNIIYYKNIIQFLLSPWGHPQLPFLIAGGPNIEASILVMNSVFLVGKRKWFYYSFLYGLLVSLVYASRTATILSLLLLFLFYNSKYSTKKERVFLGLTFIGVCIVFFMVGSLFIDNIYALKRFAQFGQDPGSLGRIALWSNALDSALGNIFQGYGAGNSIYAISSMNGIIFSEDNLHNVYLQYLIDFGILGLLLYFAFNFEVVLRFLKREKRDVFLIWLCLYIIASLVQFRGSDAILWLIIGCFYGEKKVCNSNSAL